LRSSGATLAELQLPASFAQWAVAEAGLLIVTGPSGSGKTSLVGALSELVCRERSVQLTRLDRFDEYRLESGAASVSTRSVGQHVGSYARALEAALEADSDVIACGDLEAEGAFALSVEAACSGTLVIGELPGHGAVNALEHLLLMAAEQERSQLALDLAECLLAVVSLDLLPKKGGGRVPALEVLLCTPNVAALLRDGKTSMLPGLLDREPGMQSMDRSLLDLASRGTIDGREAYARALDKRAFAAWS
jgi:twitching motility protein PilT